MKIKSTTLTQTLLMCFILLAAACSTNKSATVAGRINGTPITFSEYMDSFRGHYNNFQVLNNRVPDNNEKDLIKLQTWRDATKHVILNDYFAQYKISATAQETLDTLRQSVPEYLLNSPLFIKDGTFDRSSYLQSLEYNTPQNLQPVRRQYQSYLIPIMKLKNALIDDKLFTSKDKKLATRILQSKADIDWLILDSNDIEPLITEEDINRQYELNQPQYMLESFYSLNYIRIPVTYSRTDMHLSNALADTLYQELVLGSSMAEVSAKRFNYYPQLIQKNSGYISNGDIDPELYAMFTTMEEGAYHFPVSDKEGLTIYQLEKRTKSMSSFNTLRIPFIPSETSIEQSKTEADNVQKLITDIGLEAAVTELDLGYSTTGRLQANQSWMQDETVVNRILDTLTGKKPGYVFSPVYSSDLRSWVVAQVVENQVGKYKPLAEVRDQVTDELKARKRAEMNKYLAERVMAGEASAPANARIVASKGMRSDTRLLDMNVDTIFYQALRAHLNKEKQRYHELGKMILIPRVLAVSQDKKIQVPAADIRRMFVSTLSPTWFDAWLDAEVAKADIMIYAP